MSDTLGNVLEKLRACQIALPEKDAEIARLEECLKTSAGDLCYYNCVSKEEGDMHRRRADENELRAEQAEAARDKALADVERLRTALQEIETVPVSSSGRDYYWTGREIAKAALKETSREQDG